MKKTKGTNMKKINQSQEQKQKQLKKQSGNRRAAADAPPPVMPAPEQVVEQLRALRQQVDEGTRLTPQQRKTFRDLVRITTFAVQSSINVIGASDNISQAVGQPADEVRQKVEVSNRWSAVEDELRAMLAIISDANLNRRYEIALIAEQAYGVGVQLVRKPENAELKTHLQEIKRLKSIGRRKKASQTSEPPPQQPQPSPQAPSPASASDPSEQSQK
jgi:hypothetical protein